MKTQTKTEETNETAAVKKYTDEEIALIKRIAAPKATDAEFELFLYIAQTYGLDPLLKQIWCLKYNDAPSAIFTSRDGFLKIAHRSGRFDGMKTEKTIDAKGNLSGAKCTVWRSDMNHPFETEIDLKEYQKRTKNWTEMPETMIKKVAQSQCLRQAFDISGLYEPSEMSHMTEEAEMPKPAHALQSPPRPDFRNTPQPPEATHKTPQSPYQSLDGLTGDEADTVENALAKILTAVDLDHLSSIKKDLKTLQTQNLSDASRRLINEAYSSRLTELQENIDK